MKRNDGASGKELYEMWHKRASDKESRQKNTIPKMVPTLGTAKYIIYHSDKWGDSEDYIHDFDSGPKIYHKSGKGFKVSQEKLLGGDTTLVKLGEVIELGYLPEGEDEEVMFPIGGRPVLCSTTDKKGLVIMTSSPIIIRGSAMEVQSVGIVK